MPHTNQGFVPWDGKLQTWTVWSKADPPAPQSHPNPGGEGTPLWGCVTPKPPGRGFISPKDSLLSQPAPNPAPSLGWRSQRWHLPYPPSQSMLSHWIPPTSRVPGGLKFLCGKSRFYSPTDSTDCLSAAHAVFWELWIKHNQRGAAI